MSTPNVNLVDFIRASLATGMPIDQADAIVKAGQLIEKARGLPEIGWDDAVSASAPIDDQEVGMVREALVAFVERYIVPPPNGRGAVGSNAVGG